MRHLLILASLLFGTGAVADDADFDFKSLGAKKALRDYKATLAKEDKAKQKAIEEIEAEAKKAQKKYRVELIMNLEQALKKAMQDADLEEANKIDAAIKALKKGASPAGASVAGSKGKKKAKKSKARIPSAVGVWKWRSTIFIIYPDGTAFSGKVESGIRTGHWEATDKSGRRFKIKWGGGGLDEITMSSGGQSFDGLAPHSGARWQMVRLPGPVGGK